jgi:hypothetical protein
MFLDSFSSYKKDFANYRAALPATGTTLPAPVQGPLCQLKNDSTSHMDDSANFREGSVKLEFYLCL